MAHSKIEDLEALNIALNKKIEKVAEEKDSVYQDYANNKQDYTGTLRHSREHYIRINAINEKKCHSNLMKLI